MIAVNPNSICEEARVHYYEYLCGELRECIPAEMLAHIEKCRFCQTEVDRLNIVLAEGEVRAGQQSTRERNSVVAANLRLHFAYIGTSVTCETAKPFLPSLASPALEVRVPTPITVHLDRCQQCTDDLETIRQLNLTHKQLCRLGQLFADKFPEDAISCSQAKAGMPAVVAMALGETSAQVLKHLCTCADCRGRLYQHREKFNGKFQHNKMARRKFPCEEVSTPDIFDYVVPYGIDPANDQYAKFRPSFTSHARSCPTCLGKMQQLHRTVYSILERQESGIVTCFEMRVSDQDSVVSTSDDVYEDWPIEVQVLDKSERKPVASTASAGLQQRPKQRVSALNLKQFIKPVAAAAAISIIVAILVMFNAPVAAAVGLGQIHKALDRIKNVCITTFYQEQSKATQEIWISRTLNIKMLKTKRRVTLWDTKGKFQKSRDLNTGSITTTELGKDVLLKVKETMEGPLGLLPFSDMREAPEGAKWQPVARENVDIAIPGTRAYDLIWAEKKVDGSIVYNKWRGHVDIETKLPKRVEWWEKRAQEDEYKLLTTIKITYPTATEVRAVVRDAGF